MKRPGRINRVGMPANLYLDQFGSLVWDAFGGPPYLVGSAILGERDWHDIDVRMMLDDELYEAMGLGDPRYPHQNAKWVALCMAFSALGEKMTGLPIDFQLQDTTVANEKTAGQPRSALGLVPHRMRAIGSAEAVNP